MKMGRFEESIEAYERALSLNPNFIGSQVGIGNNYMFLDQPEQARESFGKLLEIARNDAERRRARLWMAASCVHEGEHEQCLGTRFERGRELRRKVGTRRRFPLIGVDG